MVDFEVPEFCPECEKHNSNNNTYRSPFHVPGRCPLRKKPKYNLDEALKILEAYIKQNPDLGRGSK